MARGVKDPLVELGQLSDAKTPQLRRTLLRMLTAQLNDRTDHQALERLQEDLFHTLAVGDLLGRRRTWLEYDGMMRGRKVTERERRQLLLADDPTGIVVPRVTFEEAVEDLVTREPRLAPSMEQVQRVYEGHGFAMARATSETVAQQARDILERIARDHQGLARGTRKFQELAREQAQDWTLAYTETVYRTNLNTAYTQGRVQQSRDKVVASVIGGLGFVAIRDVSTRPNHLALHGYMASQFDPVWNQLSPPLGYNCRCSVRLVDRRQMERMGLVDANGVVRTPPIPAGAGPDQGFGNRGPANAIYINP